MWVTGSTESPMEILLSSYVADAFLSPKFVTSIDRGIPNTSLSGKRDLKIADGQTCTGSTHSGCIVPGDSVHEVDESTGSGGTRNWRAVTIMNRECVQTSE